ncbi:MULTISPECIES: choline ABC transporter substrate-binding protein [Pseudomonas]|uniref:Glycine betaine/proline transport system substrate-binding protein n=1 Tax=Pseudomonas lutea TaxID=243924 RepID=A0A9X8QHG0_9PSED|nr:MULTISPECIES: choline ABC transporter substrate-binding protein [Pseudomonas]MBW5412614.1 choline ABC transporter substrate-binding protein [Pseudomonas sp. MAG002Y]SEP58106.1 glycine betaine/proline transport system substrate-binding protein [Pseudomonas lutea]
MKPIPTLLMVGAALFGTQVHAEDAACGTVRMADPGWSDISTTNAVAGFLLESLGYQSTVDTLSVPIVFGGLKDGKIDAFLGNWMPAQQGYYDQFVKSGQVTDLKENLNGTEFTLAVPKYVWDAGVKDFSDLAKHAGKFNKKVYGIGSGAPGNQSIQKMIDGNEFDLGGWQLVESSEQAMLAQVGRSVKRNQWVVFLGWTPHPMNINYEMKYLTGGEKYFGEAGTVHTLTRKGYAEQCPNVGKLLSNLAFTLDMENAIMNDVVEKKISYADSVQNWLKANPQAIEPWLQGVKTKDGNDGLDAVKAKL